MRGEKLALGVVAAVLLGCGSKEPTGEEAAVSDFRAGQVWTYKTRPGEEASRVVVYRVEPGADLGTIIHVRIEGVAVKNPASADGVTRVIGHMPLAQNALRRSVVTLESTRDAPPDCEEGYKAWRDSFDKGQAGIFTVSVAEGVEFAERAFNR